MSVLGNLLIIIYEYPRILYYERQSKDEAAAKDEATFEALAQTVMEISTDSVSELRELIAIHKAAKVTFDRGNCLLAISSSQ